MACRSLATTQSFNQVYRPGGDGEDDAAGWNAWATARSSSWLRETRWAFRLGGAAALPLNGEFFSLGGGDQFRGYDLSQRQGSIIWVGSVEWRVPLFKDLSLDVCDHVAGVRNVYLAPFYDVGDAYVNGHSMGPTAHAVGAGLRVDVAWLGLIERTIFASTSPKPSAATRRCNSGSACSIRFDCHLGSDTFRTR